MVYRTTSLICPYYGVVLNSVVNLYVWFIGLLLLYVLTMELSLIQWLIYMYTVYRTISVVCPYYGIVLNLDRP